MTPQEIQRTMDFILRSNADSVIRMERLEETWEKFEEKLNAWRAEVQDTLRGAEKLIRENAADIRAIARANRAHEKRIRTVEKSRQHIARRAESTRDLMKILTRLAAVQSKRIDRLERNGA